MNVSQMLDQRINLDDPHEDLVEKWAQNYCLSVILSGVNTNISQKAIIAMYNLSHNGVPKYHIVQLGSIEVNSKRFNCHLSFGSMDTTLLILNMVFWKCLNKLTHTDKFISIGCYVRIISQVLFNFQQNVHKCSFSSYWN